MLDETLTVSGQIAAEDVALIAAQGFRSILCNRPDDEDHGQPPFAAIEAAARAAGLEAAFQPVLSGGVSDADGADFAALMETLPKPVFAYCRSGTRCAMLWSLAQG